MINRIFTTCLFVIVALQAWATSYERHTTRMNDHFIHAEWDEVLLETDRMIELQPTNPDPYSVALIAAQFLNDISTENRYLRLSQQNRIHIDTIMVRVYDRTRSIKNAQIYEGLLLNLKENHKWMAKVFNLYLLDYYDLARKTHETITIADELLALTPDNIRIMKIKAGALFYQGDIEEAVGLYSEILSLAPDDYTSVTFLATYHAMQCHKMIEELNTRYLSGMITDKEKYMTEKQHIIDNEIAYTLTLLQQANEMTTSQYLMDEIQKLQSITPQPPHTTR